MLRKVPSKGDATAGRLGGTFPPLLTKVIFANRLKPMRKSWGWRHQLYLNFSLNYSQVIFIDRM